MTFVRYGKEYISRDIFFRALMNRFSRVIITHNFDIEMINRSKTFT